MLLAVSEVAELLGWPVWALEVIAGLSVLVLFMFVIQAISASSLSTSPSNNKNNSSGKVVYTMEFRWFQVYMISSICK